MSICCLSPLLAVMSAYHECAIVFPRQVVCLSLGLSVVLPYFDSPSSHVHSVHFLLPMSRYA